MNINSCEAEWPEFGGAADLTAGADAIAVKSPVLDDLELLFIWDARWNEDVGDVKPKL